MIFMVSLIVVTLAGNTLVVLAVILFRRLQTVTNYLLVSLALADITVAILVMPPSLLIEVCSSD